MAPKIVTYLTYSETAQAPRPTLEEFRAELAKFAAGPLLYACSVINAILRDWQGHFDSAAHDKLVKQSFPPNLANFITAAFNDRGQNPTVYHRQQLLFVMKHALQVCSNSCGIDPVASPYWGGLGIVLLMANDLIPNRQSNNVPVTQQMLNVLAELIPITEASGFHRSINRSVRSRLMFNFP